MIAFEQTRVREDSAAIVIVAVPVTMCRRPNRWSNEMSPTLGR